MITAPYKRTKLTIIEGIITGSISLNNIWKFEKPNNLEVLIKSLFFIDAVSFLTILNKLIQPAKPNIVMIVKTELPNNPTIRIIKNIVGKERNISAIRLIIVSTNPPKYPAIKPSTKPTIKEINTAPKPTKRERRVP